MKNYLSRAVAVGCSVLMLTGCGDVVIKVKKEPKNVDLSAIENFDALNLSNSQDFLKHLDNLKVIGIDLLMKELASRDYRTEVRNSIRNYRKFLIARASGGVKVDDSFYASAEECRTSGLNFNMDQANDFLGIILKTAVLAKLSEVNAPKINPAISKELAAIGQLVLMELGLKIEGTVDVTELDGVTTTSGTFTLALAEIADEQVDAATKKADSTEILSMSFTRALGANYVGSFNSTIEIGHEKADASLETLQAKLDVERKAQDDNFVHTIAFNLGVKGGASNYSRKMAFEQVAGDKEKLKITDTLNPGTAGEAAFVSLIDIKAGTQCKLSKGDEGGFVDATDGSTDGTDSTDGAVDAADGTDSTDGTDGAVDATDGGDGTDKPGKGDGDDDEPGKGDDGSVPNNPGQNPGQHPGQHPGQTA